MLRAPTVSPSRAANLAFSISFSEAVAGLSSAAKFSLGGSCAGTALAGFHALSPTSFAVNATLSQSSAGCTVIVGLLNAGVTDLAGNALGSVGAATVNSGAPWLALLLSSPF